MSERDEQVALFQWAAYAQSQYPDLEFMHASANGGHRHKAVAAKMKAEGVKRGVPDVALDAPRGGYHGLRIEMKYGKNKPTQDQYRYINYLRRQGYMVVVCRSFDAARRTIINYLDGLYEREEMDTSSADPAGSRQGAQNGASAWTR